KQIGEDALPRALPWDRIKSVNYTPFASYESYIDKLQKRHEARMSNNPEFQLLLDEIAFVQEGRDQKRISLNETIRLKEQDALQQRQLALANKRSALKGEPPFKTFKEQEKFEEERADEPTTTQQETDLLAS